jgi:hypothetical protein
MANLLFVPVLQARWSTILVGAALLISVVWRYRDLRPAVAVVVAWASIFELFWLTFKEQVTFHHPQPWQGFLFLAVFVAGWIAALSYARIGPSIDWLVVSAAIFALWVLEGFHFNVYAQRAPLALTDELLNVGSKTALGVALLMGALRIPTWPSSRLRRLAARASAEEAPR